MYAGGAYLVNGATEIDIRRFSYNFARQVDDDLRTVNTFRRKVIPLTRHRQHVIADLDQVVARRTSA
jgi:hypothetical protein